MRVRKTFCSPLVHLLLSVLHFTLHIQTLCTVFYQERLSKMTTSQNDAISSSESIFINKSDRIGAYKTTFNHFLRSSVAIIGAPLCKGQDHELGVEHGPKAIRDAGLKSVIEQECQNNCVDFGDVKAYDKDGANIEDALATRSSTSLNGSISTNTNPNSSQSSQILFYGVTSKDNASTISIADPQEFSSNLSNYPSHLVKHSRAIGEACKELYSLCSKAHKEDRLPLVLGGDHSVASASIFASLQYCKNLGVIWIDAHPDCNTPDISSSHNYHGMPAAHVLGWFSKDVEGFEWAKGLKVLPAFNLVYIGLRDIDPLEKELIRKNKVTTYTMYHVDKYGIAKVVEMALKQLKDCDGIHLSFDIDAVDPRYAPGTGTLARGGLSYRESHYICEEVCSSNKLVAIDMVEINPIMDKDNENRRAAIEALARSLIIGAEQNSGSPLNATLSCTRTNHNDGSIGSEGVSSTFTVSAPVDLSSLSRKTKLHGDSELVDQNATLTVRLGVELIGSLLGKRLI